MTQGFWIGELRNRDIKLFCMIKTDGPPVLSMITFESNAVAQSETSVQLTTPDSRCDDSLVEVWRNACGVTKQFPDCAAMPVTSAFSEREEDC